MPCSMLVYAAALLRWPEGVGHKTSAAVCGALYLNGCLVQLVSGQLKPSQPSGHSSTLCSSIPARPLSR